MQNDDRHRWLWPLTLMACAVLALYFGQRREWHNLAMYGMIHADAQGYYGYLVAAFIERSFDWQQVIAAYDQTYYGGGASDFTVMTDHGPVNKYYVGTALLMLPFFVLSCVGAWFTGQPVDGYSVPFHVGMMLAALFYALSGLWFLGRFLRGRGFSWGVISGTVLGVFGGTGLFFYTVMEPAMSHAYSFFLFSAFILAADRAIQRPERPRLLLLAMITALIALVRPTNAVIVLSMPFIAGGWRPFVQFLREVFSHRDRWMLPVFLALAVVFIQPLMYVLQVGRPFVWSYSGEGFNFRDPQIMNVLFSFKKGFFIYYPWAFLAALGWLPLLLRSKGAALWLAVFLGVAVCIISSWWSWYYGASFGMRAMLEYLPFFAVLMAYLLTALPEEFRSGAVVLSLLAVPVNLIQTYQYNKFILHWDQMDEDRFWEVFLRTDERYEGIFYRGATVDALPPADRVLHRHVLRTDLEEEMGEWGTQGFTDRTAFSGVHASCLGGDNPYGTTVGIPWSDLGPEGDKVLVATFMVRSDVGRPPLALAYTFLDGDRYYGHGYLYCSDRVPDKDVWTAVRVVAELPRPEDPSHKWIVYPYITGTDTLCVDDIRYEVITLR